MSNSAHAADAVAQPGWDGSASLGLTLTHGNSESGLFTAKADLASKRENYEILIGADGAIGKSEGTKNQESLHGFVQYNFLFTERAYGFLRVDGLHDAIADITYRLTISPGVGYYFIKQTETTLSGEVGPGLVHEKVGTGVNRTYNTYFTMRLAEKFEHKFSKTARIWQSLEVLPQIDNVENFIANAEIGVEAGLTERTTLRVYIQDTYDNDPAPGREKNDVKLVSAVGWKF